MNMLKKFISSIIIMLFVIVVIFPLLRGPKFFLENLFRTVLFTIQTNNYELLKRFKMQEANILMQLQDIKDCFLNHMYVSFSCFDIYVKLLNIFFGEQIKKSLNDMISKLMHQSCDLLNSDLIANTTTIVELETQSDKKVYWIIQLGALRNFNNVSEIVAKLKIHNYPVYISPEYPVFGELVRIFVGPDLSKENLEYMLNDLYRLSHLQGKIYLYRESA